MSERISVVLPTYNSASTLPDAIRSVRNQNWSPLEIIVIDDGSTDETQAVLSSLAADDLCIMRQENSGPGAARNRGIEAAKGTWVAFLDADDLWLPGKLQAQMDLLRQCRSSSFCYSDSLRRTGDGVERLQKPHRVMGNIFADLLLGPQFDLPTVIVRRSCFDTTGLFDPNLRTGEDWDMWLRVAANFPGCYLPKAMSLIHLARDPEKYPVDLHEKCRMRIITRALSRPEAIRQWPQLIKYRRRFYSWHYAVLAKSYLFRGHPGGFLRLSAAAVLMHPLGLYFLARRWRVLNRWPNLAGLQS